MMRSDQMMLAEGYLRYFLLGERSMSIEKEIDHL